MKEYTNVAADFLHVFLIKSLLSYFGGSCDTLHSVVDPRVDTENLHTPDVRTYCLICLTMLMANISPAERFFKIWTTFFE